MHVQIPDVRDTNTGESESQLEILYLGILHHF